MLINLPALLMLNLRVRVSLRRDGFASTLAHYAPDPALDTPSARLTSGTRELSCVLVCQGKQIRHLQLAQSAALWLRRFAHLPRRAGVLGPWLQRLLGSSACLDQAITLRTFLTTRGVAASLKIGTKRGDDHKITAHAWVEVADIALGERSEMRDAHAVFSELH
jgi:hypothetical protein